MDIIFYGAGREAQKRLNHLEKKGLIPACFADADASKHYTKFNDTNYKILPLDIAITMYPDYELHVLLGTEKLHAVTDFLITKGIPKERIKYAGRVYRYGCRVGGRYFAVGDFVTACCGVLGSKIKHRIPLNDDPAKMFADYTKLFQTIFDDLYAGRKTKCEGCPHLYRGFYDESPRCDVISFISAPGAAFCNFNCQYCQENSQPVDKKSASKYYERMNSILHYAVDHKLGIEEVELCCGEITTYEKCDEIVDYISANGMNIVVYTNASIFSKSIARAIEKKKAKLHIALDCGTTETFQKIKGRNMFNLVKANIVKYLKNTHDPSMHLLKYIIMDGINTNHDDIDGFLEFAKQMGCSVIISADATKQDIPLSESGMDAVEYMLRSINNNDISFECIAYELFHPLDVKSLKRFADKQRIVYNYKMEAF